MSQPVPKKVDKFEHLLLFDFQIVNLLFPLLNALPDWNPSF